MSENKTEAAAVIEATPPITMDVTVRPIAPKDNLLGFANVTFNNAVTVTDFKVLRGEKGIYVGMPSKAAPGSPTGYTNTARIPDSEIRQQLTEAVIAQYHIEVENLRARVEAINSLEPGKEAHETGREAQKDGKQAAKDGKGAAKEGKPPRIADQFREAKKEAAAHNAALPDPAKDGRVKNADR